MARQKVDLRTTCRAGHPRALYQRYNRDGGANGCTECKRIRSRRDNHAKKQQPPPPAIGWQMLYDWKWDKVELPKRARRLKETA